MSARSIVAALLVGSSVVTTAPPLGALAHGSYAQAAPADGGQSQPPPRPLLMPSRGQASARPNEGLYQLRKTSDGGYVWDDSRFQAVVAPDGHVTFRDVHAHSDTRLLGIPLRLDRTDGVDQRPSLVTIIERKLRTDTSRPMYQTPPGFPVLDPSAVWDPALRLPALGRGPPFAAAVVSVAGTFDLTDELMKSAGQGWYRFEKAKFLSATFEFRLKMAAARHRELLKQSLAELPARLDALWGDPSFSPREKRGIICLLWAEVDFDAADARAAADVLMRWIRERLPAGGPDAYATAETSACSIGARRAFDPYMGP